MFQDGDDAENIVANAADSPFMGWMRYNRTAGDPQSLQYLYAEFPWHYRWDKGQKRWVPRKQWPNIGRPYFIHPSKGELYFLRLLLNHVRGAGDFDDFLWVPGRQGLSANYRDACLARGLLEGDEEWDRCLTEAATFQMGQQLRCLFAQLLLFCNPSSPLQLWRQHWDQLTDDVLRTRRAQAQNPALDLTREQIDAIALFHVQDLLSHHGRSLADFGIPVPEFDVATLGLAPCVI